jgi:uncharacterized membrane protein YfcA
MSIFDIVLILTFVFIAYYLKGFSGFGPALVLIPILSIIIDPGTAITAAAFFDMFAGLILFVTVFKRIDWKFVIPVTILIFAGAYQGAFFLKSVPIHQLKILIAAGLLFFVAILTFAEREDPKRVKAGSHWLQYPIALFSGFIGGLIGITGPVLIIYLKFKYQKEYFRTQLIAVFFFGALWRFILYQIHAISFKIGPFVLVLMGLTLIAGLYFGYHTHRKVDERRFNRIIAVILLIPALNLLYDGLQGMSG